MSVTADEINYLIHRYLEESDCPHTAFIFGSECRLDQANIQATQLPPQALLTILKKGMLYMQMEKGINEKAKTDDSPDSIVISITEAVRNEEPIVPVKQAPPVPAPETPARDQKVVQKQTEGVIPTPVPIPIQIPQRKALILSNHTGDVYCGAWSCDGRLFAAGSRDATTVIWEIQNNQCLQYVVLDHAQTERQNKDIAALAWNPEGTLLATGCYDGTARLWTNKGELKNVLGHHEGPVYTVQFSPDGTYLLTGSSDSKIILWNAHTGEIRQIFQHHKSHVLDVDWRDDRYFASCSSDYKVIIYMVGEANPYMIYDGHKEEVNKISWDPTKMKLASCSDDNTITVLHPFEKKQPVILQGHTKHVYTISWCPTDPNLLASGAFDYTVRLWNVETQQCLKCLPMENNQNIYTISFSPKGTFFVTGGIDSKLYIYRTCDRELVAVYDTGSGIYEAHWDPTGKNIATCLANADVAIIPTSELPMFQE